MNNKGYQLNFNKNSIDYLGIKLYSSYPPVIVGMISNSYDVDAQEVKININFEKKSVKERPVTGKEI